MASQPHEGQGEGDGSANPRDSHEEPRTEVVPEVSTAGWSIPQVPVQVVRLEDLQKTVDTLVAKAIDKGSPSPAAGECLVLSQSVHA